MLDTYPVGKPSQGKGGTNEIVIFAGTVAGRGVVINMIVNMALVNVGTDEILILPLCPAHGRFIAELVGLLRRDLALGKRLPDLEEQSAALHGPARLGLILALREQKLGVSRCGIAEVGGNGSQLFRVQTVGEPLLHCLDGALIRRFFVGPDIRCGRGQTSSHTASGGCVQPPRSVWDKSPEASAGDKIPQGKVEIVQLFDQPVRDGWKPKGRDQERDNKTCYSSGCLPRDKGNDGQQGHANTRHIAQRPADAKQECDDCRHHREHHDKGGGKDF